MLNIPNDSILAKHLSVDLRKRLQGEGGSIIELNDPTSVLIEIPICQTSTTTNILLDGSVPVIDGINVNECTFILIKDQTDKTENGIYFNDFTKWTGLVGGMLIIVQKGTTNELTYWKNINTEIIDGNDIEFELFGSGTLIAGTNGQTLRFDPDDVLIATNWQKYTTEIDGSEGLVTLTIDMAGEELDEIDWSQLILIKGILRAENGRFEITHDDGYTNISRQGIEISNTSEPTYIDLNGTESSLTLTGLDTQTSDFITCDLVTASVPSNKFNVDYTGKIKSNSLTANTILRANSSKEIVSVTNGTNDQCLIYDGVSIHSFTDRVTNRSSFLTTDHVYSNLQVTPETDPPITSYVELGNYSGTTTFKLSLLAGRRYQFEARLLISTNVGSAQNFQLKLVMPSAWQTQLFTTRAYNQIQNQPDISILSYNLDSVIEVPKNTELAFFVDDDITADIMELWIKGTIDTPTSSGNVTFDVRNITRFSADGTNQITFRQGSNMSVMECKIN